MRFFRARSLILSPSNKSIARHALPPRPALKSLSGSGRLAPLEKVSFTLSYLPVGLQDGLADAGERFATPVCESCDELINTFRWIHWIFMPPILVPF